MQVHIQSLIPELNYTIKIKISNITGTISVDHNGMSRLCMTITGLLINAMPSKCMLFLVQTFIQYHSFILNAIEHITGLL